MQTDFDKQIEKFRRKEEKKNHKRGTGNAAFAESELEWLPEAGGFSALVDASEGFLDNLIGQGDEIGRALPKGTSRKVSKGYEEVKVPATATTQLKPDERLVNITPIFL